MLSQRISIPLTMALFASTLFSDGEAFSMPKGAAATRHTTALTAEQNINNEPSSDRRGFLYSTASLLMIPAAAAAIMTGSPMAAVASTTTTTTLETKALIADLESTRSKLDAIPGLLEAGEWEKVRTILKTPPVNFLWNMGDSKNPVLQLAKATDEFELIDLKDEISISLQMCDQLTYDNVFVYFQPGNGKVKVKEPVDLAKKAMKQLDDALQLAKGE